MVYYDLRTDGDFWYEFPGLFQLTSGKGVDISWYTQYTSEDGGSGVVDLDEMIRENERRLHLIGSLINRSSSRRPNSMLRRKKRKTFQRTRSRSKSEAGDKDVPVAVHRKTVSQTRLQLSSGIKKTNSASPKIKKDEITKDRKDGEDDSSPRVSTFVLRPESSGHVTMHDNVDGSLRHPRLTPNHLNAGVLSQETHYSTHAKEESDDDGQSPLVVSDLVSKFENVPRLNPSPRLRVRGSLAPTEDKPNNGHPHDHHTSHDHHPYHHSIRVISFKNKPHGSTKTKNSEVDGTVSHERSFSPNLDPLKSGMSPLQSPKNRFPLLKTKSEGNIRQTAPPDSPTVIRRPTSEHSIRLDQTEAQRTTSKRHSVDSMHHPTLQRVDAEFHLPQQRHAHGINDHDSPAHNGLPNDAGVAYLKRTDTVIERLAGHNHSASSVRDPVVLVNPVTKAASDTPVWKTDLEMRKRTKPYVQSSKVEQPFQLMVVPEWKRQLVEKNRLKRNSSGLQHNPFSHRKPETVIYFTEPPWQLEFEKIKLHHQTTQHDSYFSTLKREVPEWVTLAEERQKAKRHTHDDDRSDQASNIRLYFI